MLCTTPSCPRPAEVILEVDGFTRGVCLVCEDLAYDEGRAVLTQYRIKQRGLRRLDLEAQDRGRSREAFINGIVDTSERLVRAETIIRVAKWFALEYKKHEGECGHCDAIRSTLDRALSKYRLTLDAPAGSPTDGSAGDQHPVGASSSMEAQDGKDSQRT